MAAAATQTAAEFARGGGRAALRVPLGLPVALLAGGVSALVGGVSLLPPLAAGRYVAATEPGPKRGGAASAEAACPPTVLCLGS